MRISNFIFVVIRYVDRGKLNELGLLLHSFVMRVVGNHLLRADGLVFLTLLLLCPFLVLSLCYVVWLACMPIAIVFNNVKTHVLLTSRSCL